MSKRIVEVPKGTNVEGERGKWRVISITNQGGESRHSINDTSITSLRNEKSQPIWYTLWFTPVPCRDK